ncbi:MAG TPA: cation:proton antiporter [Acidimicrobiia bacterium]|nr:cation:proton antiporter [Acidimicrobiia bacterium]
MSVDRYELALAVAGLAALLAAWLPAYVSRRPLSLPIALVALGVAVFALPLGLDAPRPWEHIEVTERLTELGVIVALMGAGLKIDRPFGWRRWATTGRLLAIAMPLTIVGIALTGAVLLGLGAASALLLGAVLAPTDPVIASEVQVGEPTVEEDEGDEEDDVRFSLTSEAGLNDALAFPFVYAALHLAANGEPGLSWLGGWLLVDVGYRIGAATLAGLTIGWLLAVIMFRPPGPFAALANASQGFVALAATFLAYGVTELIHGYGFLAVFVAAVALRSAERRHSYHRVLHGFSEQAETLLVVGLLVMFGGALTAGLLSELSWRVIAVAAVVLFVVRPLSGWIALHRSPAPRDERLAIAFFGVRGVGSLYYLAYALSAEQFADERLLWTTVAVIIVGSIAIHGVTAAPVMHRLDRTRERWRRSRARRRDRSASESVGASRGT